jgi:hypothetical protein
VLVAAFDAGTLLGWILSPVFGRALPIRAILVLELWTWPAWALFLV